MNELQSDNLWVTIRQLAKKSNVRRAAIAYVSNEEQIEFKKGDILVTDASDAAIKAGQTSAKVLGDAFERGATLYSLSGLHAKVMQFDGVAVIGSANASQSSVSSLIEAAWVTDSPQAVGMVASFISQLAGKAKPINAAFIDRITKLSFSRRAGGPRKPSGLNIKVRQPHTWVVYCSELEDEFEQEAADIARGEKIAESKINGSGNGVGWLRWTGKSRFRTEAAPGDQIIQIYTRSNEKTPRVYRHAPILHKQDEPACTRFFVEHFANAEETKLTWRAFEKLLKQTDLAGKVRQTSVRAISTRDSEALAREWKG